MFKIIIIFVFILSFTINAEVVTKTTFKTVEGSGEGLSRSEAVNNALIEAISQLSGVYIKQEKFMNDLSIESSKGDYSSYQYNNKIKRITKGKADSYKIIEVNELNGKYKIRVKVTNSKTKKYYKTPGLNNKNRRSIVVVPGNFILGSFNILGESKSFNEANINLSQELLNKITETRKFNVLDREESRAYINEKKVIQSEDAAKNEVLKLGKVLSADYILLTSIKNLEISKEKRNRYISNTNDSLNVSVTVQFKIITTATRQVKLSKTRSYNFEEIGNSNREIYYNILSKVSSEISTEIIENIYPLKIVKMNANEITINQGNLKLGSKYEVFELGEKIIDSYTKESLGRSEIKVGEAEIIRILPKYSIAKIIEGNASKNNILRSIVMKNKKDEFEKVGKESDVEINSNGGVVLPFD